jgi:hypothetical protein
MKKTILVIFIMLSAWYSNAQIFASSINANETSSAGFTEFSGYNFTHFDQRVNLIHFNYGYDKKHVLIGPVMVAGGGILAAVGIIGLSNPGGGDRNLPPPGKVTNWKSHNTYSDIAIAGGALFTAGLIVCIAEGDIHGGHSGYYGGHSSGGWWFGHGRHHDHFRHKEHRGGGHKSHHSH